MTWLRIVTLPTEQLEDWENAASCRPDNSPLKKIIIILSAYNNSRNSWYSFIYQRIPAFCTPPSQIVWHWRGVCILSFLEWLAIQNPRNGCFGGSAMMFGAAKHYFICAANFIARSAASCWQANASWNQPPKLQILPACPEAPWREVIRVLRMLRRFLVCPHP